MSPMASLMLGWNITDHVDCIYGVTGTMGRVDGDEETWVLAGDSRSSDLKGHDSGAGVAAAR
jgi:hypothetical protein